MQEHRANLEPPRTLKGRRARRIWRELAQKLAARDQLHAGTNTLLAAYASTIAEIEADPNQAHALDLKQAQALGRALGLSK